MKLKFFTSLLIITISLQSYFVFGQEGGKGNCDKAAEKLISNKNALNSSLKNQISQYQTGMFCSKCYKPMEAFGGYGSFHKHVIDVGGTAITQELKQQLIAEIKQKIQGSVNRVDSIIIKINLACSQGDSNMVRELSQIQIKKEDYYLENKNGLADEQNYQNRQNLSQVNQQNDGKGQDNQQQIKINSDAAKIKPVWKNKCDQIFLKKGDTLLVDIMGVDKDIINYLICDSTQPIFTVKKKEVLAVKYSNREIVYYNNETYGAVNTNSFGYIKPGFNPNDIPSIKKVKRKYYHNDRPITFRELKFLLANNQAAAPEYRMFKTRNKTQNTFYYIGAFTMLVGAVVPLVGGINSVNNGHYKKDDSGTIGVGIMAGGLGLEIIGIFAGSGSLVHLNKSIDLYNSNVKAISLTQIKFNLIANFDGIGIRMRF